jgi:glycosyltransferase involved in cell wall biosynthesis
VVKKNSKNMKNILHLNYSKSGGAGRVAKILFENQSNMSNYNSKYLFAIDSDLRSSPVKDTKTSIRASVDNYIVKDKNFRAMFSLYREHSNTTFLELIKSHAGIIHLHWVMGIVHQDKLLSDYLREKPLVWTLHDMAPITGGCHNSMSCQKFLSTCDECPAVKKIFTSQVRLNKRRKNIFLANKKNLALVFPSNWSLDQAKPMPDLKGKSLNVIWNPVENEFFKEVDKSRSRAKYGVPLDAVVIGFVSQNIDNPLKRFSLLISSLNKIGHIKGKEIVIVAIGASKKDWQKETSHKIVITGSIDDSEILAEHYSMVDVMASTSEAETFGLSIAEAAAMGIPSVVLSGTATEELVNLSGGGLVSNEKNDFIKNISRLIEDPELVKNLGGKAKRFSLDNLKVESVLKKYNQVYESVM